jgi:uncharacterized protein (TIGR02391 family)
MNPNTRRRVVDLLAAQSGGVIHSFFVAHGLGQAYQRRENDSRAAKTANALTEAERRGNLDAVLQDAAIRFGGATESGVALKSIGKLRHELQVVEGELSGKANIDRKAAQELVEELNRLLEHVRGYVGDEAPDSVEIPTRYFDNSSGLLTDSGRNRLEAIAKRAVDLLPSAREQAGLQLDPRITALHAEVYKVARPLLAGGHGDNAVEEACKVVAKRVRDLSGLQTDGVGLMTAAFSPQSPTVRLNDLKNQTERDEQLGYMYLSAGLIAAARNPRAHRPSGGYDEDEVFEFLAVASAILRRLDRVK